MYVQGNPPAKKHHAMPHRVPKEYTRNILTTSHNIISQRIPSLSPKTRVLEPSYTEIQAWLQVYLFREYVAKNNYNYKREISFLFGMTDVDS